MTHVLKIAELHAKQRETFGMTEQEIPEHLKVSYFYSKALLDWQLYVLENVAGETFEINGQDYNIQVQCVTKEPHRSQYPSDTLVYVEKKCVLNFYQAVRKKLMAATDILEQRQLNEWCYGNHKNVLLKMFSQEFLNSQM